MKQQKERIFAIGDVHGALKALQQLIGKIAPQPEDKLIFLGDYVDGWSQSAEVIDYLIELDKLHDCIFMKGNHDAWCEEWLISGKPDSIWVFQGGSVTVDSYRNVSEEKRTVHLDFFNRMQNFYIDDQNRLFVHAGFASLRGPQAERYEANFRWDRTLWETALATSPRLNKTSMTYPKRLLLFSEIFIGHTPTTNYGKDKPMRGSNVWNVDTGAAFRGKISALEVNTKKVLQSDNVYTFYPGERGRNV
ncbi:metallophosphoesterase family protein [uncultured Chitinophaga sp.]|uniref:metallophosphoesterase family protein n=1 Tax=uncultured Chitinophaga sp. TaxID=339340 RepID=UPI0026002CDD|nr:metallophosphoesterase family protein [uncultured Chitinophaga sp.]